MPRYGRVLHSGQSRPGKGLPGGHQKGKKQDSQQGGLWACTQKQPSFYSNTQKKLGEYIIKAGHTKMWRPPVLTRPTCSCSSPSCCCSTLPIPSNPSRAVPFGRRTFSCSRPCLLLLLVMDGRGVCSIEPCIHLSYSLTDLVPVRSMRIMAQYQKASLKRQRHLFG